MISLISLTWLMALLSLGLVLACVWRRWSFRRKVWLSEPERLLEALTPAQWVVDLAVLFSIAAAASALLAEPRWHLPFAVWFASFGAFGAAHLRWNPLRGAVGVSVLMVTFITLGESWIWSGYAGQLIGAVLGLGLARWLARFWDQQLDDGRAWTTAGFMIPVSRRVALAMLPVILVLALLTFWPAGGAE